MLEDRDTYGSGAQRVTVTIGGKTFDCGRRTAAHLAYTEQQLVKRYPRLNLRLEVIQGCYNDGVEASEGTHDYDGVLDVRIVGLLWWEAQWFLRTCGWAAWYRYPPTFSSHVHMVSLGCPAMVGLYVPGQVDDYYRHALGLKGQHDSGDDTSRFPSDIDATVFDFEAWEKELEDVSWNDWTAAEQKAMAKAVVDELFARKIPTIADPKKTVTFVEMIRRAGNAPTVVRSKTTKILNAIKEMTP